MKTTNKSYVHLLFILTFSLLLSSCYLNTAGHIFDKAKYDAVVTTQNIKGKDGQVVYSDGESHYIKVSRYRVGKPITTQYNALVTEDEKSVERQYKGESVVKIPANYARYLTGKAGSPTKPKYMEPVSNSVLNRCTTTSPIVRTPRNYEHQFRYTSPAAAGYYTLGVLDWLCVDLPVTCVENALLVTAVGLASMDTTSTNTAGNYDNYGATGGNYGYSSAGAGGSSYSTRSRGSSSLTNQTTKADCTRCNGKGVVSNSYTGGYVDCPACVNGKVTSTTRVGRDSNGVYRKQCTLCHGQKRWSGKRCPSCLGKGYKESFFTR